MNTEITVTAFAQMALAKRSQLHHDPLAFMILAMMAGAYVGFGILLIFSVGQAVDPNVRPVVMGVSFGLALLLVIFAGAELFTGHTMYMTHGLLTRRTSARDLLICWSVSWSGNLIGAIFLASLFVYAGGGQEFDGQPNLFHAIASKKIRADGLSLFLNGILCNWLVCLALWMSVRVQNEMAKIALVWFCLYAFIATGFEHSVANMTIFSVALLSEHPQTIHVTGALRNLAFVSLGNAVAGAGIMGVGYWIAAGRPRLAHG